MQSVCCGGELIIVYATNAATATISAGITGPRGPSFPYALLASQIRASAVTPNQKPASSAVHIHIGRMLAPEQVLREKRADMAKPCG